MLGEEGETDVRDEDMRQRSLASRLGLKVGTELLFAGGTGGLEDRLTTFNSMAKTNSSPEDVILDRIAKICYPPLVIFYISYKLHHFYLAFSRIEIAMKRHF